MTCLLHGCQSCLFSFLLEKDQSELRIRQRCGIRIVKQTLDNGPFLTMDDLFAKTLSYKKTFSLINYFSGSAHYSLEVFVPSDNFEFVLCLNYYETSHVTSFKSTSSVL